MKWDDGILCCHKKMKEKNEIAFELTHLIGQFFSSLYSFLYCILIFSLFLNICSSVCTITWWFWSLLPRSLPTYLSIHLNYISVNFFRQFRNIFCSINRNVCVQSSYSWPVLTRFIHSFSYRPALILKKFRNFHIFLYRHNFDSRKQN